MKTVKPGDFVRHPDHPDDRFEVYKVEGSRLQASSRWNEIDCDASEVEPWARILHDHVNDADGNPAGGRTVAKGIDISWQDGPLLANGHNGAFVEDVIEAAIGRLLFYQGWSRFHCIHNAVALGHLQAALEVLNERTRDRTDRGVEGTHIL